jgi:hypothetical protein
MENQTNTLVIKTTNQLSITKDYFSGLHTNRWQKNVSLGFGISFSLLLVLPLYSITCYQLKKMNKVVDWG